jgi:hypothetical protein
MAETIEKRTTVWEGLKEHPLGGEELLEFLEFGSEGVARTLEKIKVNEYLVVESLPAGENNTQKFQNVIAALEREGLEIGKGDAKYGYKMPLPKKYDDRRNLIVFRRN